MATVKKVPIRVNTRVWRRANLFSQQDLAENLGVALRTIQNWESGVSVPSAKLGKKLRVFVRKYERKNA